MIYLSYIFPILGILLILLIAVLTLAKKRKTSTYVMSTIAVVVLCTFVITSCVYSSLGSVVGATREMKLKPLMKGLLIQAVEDELLFKTEGNDRKLYYLTDLESGKPQADSVVCSEDLTGMTIVFYRPDCTDCHAILPLLKASLKEHGITEVRYVASRSWQGELLRKYLPIPEVPYAVYIRGYEENAFGYVSRLYADAYPLYERDENRNPVYLYENVKLLIENYKDSTA